MVVQSRCSVRSATLFTIVILFQDGWSLLHLSANGGSVDLVDWLIETFDFDVHQWTKVYLMHSKAKKSVSCSHPKCHNLCFMIMPYTACASCLHVCMD